MGELLRKYKSDTWDSGNYLTRFFECYYSCDYCGGSGVVTAQVHVCCGALIGGCGCSEDGGEIEERRVECAECGGTGEIVVFE